MADASLIFNIVAHDMASSKLDKIKASAKLLGVAVGIMAVKFGKDSVSAFVAAQDSQDKLHFALAKFPKLADTNITRLGTLNSALEMKTKFDDDATASGQAVLGQFVSTGKQLEQLTPLIQDYAAKTGKDLPTAATTMGKAFLGNTRALKELGIHYKATGDKSTDMANITQLMRDKVGGFAEVEGKSAAGQADILKNRFGDVQEKVGGKLVPALIDLASGLVAVIGFVQQNITWIAPLVTVVGTAIVAYVAVSKAIVVFNAVMELTGAATTIAMGPLGLVIIVIAALAAGLIYAYKHSETFRNFVNTGFAEVKLSAELMWHALQTAFTAIVTAFVATKDAISTTVGKVVGFFRDLPGNISGAFGDGFGWLHDKALAIKDWVGNKVTQIVRFFINLPGDIVSGAGDLFGHIKDKAEALRTYIRSKVDAVVGFFTGIPGRLAGQFTGAFDGIASAFRAAINAAIDVWNNFHIPGVSVKGITIVPAINTPNLAHLAAGGIVTGPTLALLGEGGYSEMVTPLDGRHGMGGVTNIHLHVTAPVGSNARDIGGELVQYLQAYVRGNGPIRGLTA